MKTILIFSDSHGSTNDMHRIVQAGQWDMVFHLGDCYDDMLELKECYDIPIYGVPGNVDLVKAQGILSLEVEGFNICLCHGDQFSVKSSLDYIRQYATKAQVDIILFGHSHIAYMEENDYLLMNPGSIKFPRGEKSKSYGVIELESSKCMAKIIYE